MSSGSLRKLLAGWNQVCQLAEMLESSQLEVLDLQHNHLTDLPHNLFIKAQRFAPPIKPFPLLDVPEPPHFPSPLPGFTIRHFHALTVCSLLGFLQQLTVPERVSQ